MLCPLWPRRLFSGKSWISKLTRQQQTQTRNACHKPFHTLSADAAVKQLPGWKSFSLMIPHEASCSPSLFCHSIPLYIWQSLHPSVHLTITLSLCTSDSHSIPLSIWQSLYPSVHLTVTPSLCTSDNHSIPLYIWQSLHPSIHLTVTLSLCPSDSHSIPLYIWQSLHLCQSDSHSIPLSIYTLSVHSYRLKKKNVFLF